MSTPMLEISEVCASYGEAQALFGVTLSVMPGEAVSLMGRNGMGKSTTVKAVMGMLPLTAGSIRFDGELLRGEPVYRVARRGIGLVPEGRQIFSTLSVRENLIATAGGEGPWTLSSVYALFPRLRERENHLGAQLSGGEQQMLAIGRALMTNPRLLILDEATEGLAPLIREEIWSIIRRLRDRRQAILIIDKNIRALSELCDRHAVLERGRIVWEGGFRCLGGAQRRGLPAPERLRRPGRSPARQVCRLAGSSSTVNE
ncbi:ABC transporter ATP-binding protein [Aquabacterium sp. J223]|uniref:ABC transporter ATP-binding protein n=1 Tax=Aquabacterium sp. J223 TaxID=2898431 RepID=UPI0021ADEDD4|nr:ABC transporter ATP-binding protein [Aquabacterium sp. J223]UUX95279.1 ABC transporter ATP-binding protein [Aquabacterium sp. J223]